MSVSTASVNPLNIPLSPMRVNFNGVDLGGTVNEVTLSKKILLADVMVDQLGKTSLDKKVSGYDYSVKFTISEVKNKDNWKVVFPSDQEVNSGTKSIISTIQIGDSMYAKAGVLILHPLENADGDLSGDYKFEKAASIQVTEIKYGPDKQSGLTIEMHIFPNLNVSPGRFMIFGDPTIGIVNAAAAAAVPGGGNTGNGTISAEAVFNAVTKTETITLTCLDAVTGNNFSVTGSLSGALGVLHVGATSGNTANFVPTTGSPQVITFTLNQGSVQFVAGDSFTIATTASNFA